MDNRALGETYRVAREYSRDFARQLAWSEYYYALKVRYPWMNELELINRKGMAH